MRRARCGRSSNANLAIERRGVSVSPSKSSYAESRTTLACGRPTASSSRSWATAAPSSSSSSCAVAQKKTALIARHDARDALRAKLALREADGVDGEFQWTRFKVWRVRRDHAAVLARLGEYSLLDASDLELAELSGASLASCLDSLAYLRPRQLRRWWGAAPGAR